MTNAPAPINALTDEAWHEVVKRSLTERAFEGVELPGFPPAEVQERFVGASYERALDEAFNFYTAIKRAVAEHGGGLGDDSRVLDFGVGWGRILRYFLKDVPETGLYGLDAMPLAIDLCKQIGCPGSLVHGAQLPPSVFAADSFDVVYAYSVFSHLSERAQLAWVEELGRVLRPGGLLVVTSRSDYFLSYVEQLDGRREQLAGHEEQLLATFPDLPQVRARYEAGEFVFVPYATGGGGGGLDEELYGEAFVPRAYAERVWGERLAFRGFTDDPAQLPQSVIVLQKQ